MGNRGNRGLDEQQRLTLINHITRRMKRMSDNDLIKLEEATREEITRRGFLKTLIVGIASAAFGASATALVSPQRQSASRTPAPPPITYTGPAPYVYQTPLSTSTPLPTAPPTATSDIPSETEARIRALERTVSDLAAQRDDLLAQVSQLQANLQDSLSQISSLQTENASLKELVTLYQQLEATGLDEAIISGFGPVGLAMLATAGSRVTVESEVITARSALNDLESDAPAISDGLTWLQARLSELANSLQIIEDTISQAVEPARPFTELVGEFIRTVLNLLPFGVGEPIVAGLEAIGTLLTNLPELLNNAGVMIISPMQKWYSGDEPEVVSGVVKPVRDQALTAAEKLAQDTATLENAYNEQLVRPVEDIISRRRAIREQIEAA